MGCVKLVWLSYKAIETVNLNMSKNKQFDTYIAYIGMCCVGGAGESPHFMHYLSVSMEWVL